jgi:hypothetical protein
MAKLDYEMDTIDVKTAFLYAPLQEVLFVKIPDGYPNSDQLRKKNKVLRLLKSLYGLKQAPIEWNKDIDKNIRSIGFEPLISESCIYVGNYLGKSAYILTPCLNKMKNLKVEFHISHSLG